MALQISSRYGASPDWFGHQDYIENRLQGASDDQILSFLNANRSLLRERNRQGVADGLYEQILSNRVTGAPDFPEPTPEFTLDPRIGDLQAQLGESNRRISDLTTAYDASTKSYNDQLKLMQGNIEGYVKQIGGYQDQINMMDKRLLEQAKNAKQFKKMDTKYLLNNKAAGIRLKRTKKSRLGLNTLGTSGLNRRNRGPLKISNVNL